VTTDRRVQALADATLRRRQQAEEAVTKALRKARAGTGPVTIAGIAAAAGVSSDFIYRHRTLRPQVEALRQARATARTSSPAIDPDASAAESTLVRRLTHQLAQARREHREQVTELRTALEAAHGELLLLRRQLADRPIAR
jgi:hypothetical protein